MRATPISSSSTAIQPTTSPITIEQNYSQAPPCSPILDLPNIPSEHADTHQLSTLGQHNGRQLPGYGGVGQYVTYVKYGYLMLTAF